MGKEAAADLWPFFWPYFLPFLWPFLWNDRLLSWQEEEMDHAFLLVCVGLLIGTLGTMLGIGGGFVLIPLLAYLHPDWPPQKLTAVSLAVVFLNSLSGTIAYARQKRIHYRSAILFTVAALPGTIAGAFLIARITRETFDPLFGSFLFLVSVFLFFKRAKEHPEARHSSFEPNYNVFFGIILSTVVGLVSSILGIGGGIIHVPAMVHLLGFPVHMATATSHMTLAGMSLTASIVHLWNGDLNEGFQTILVLAPSVVIGAQLGAKLSHRISGAWIIRLLAVLLAFLAVRLLIR